MPNEVAKAYTAGIIDGEGSISLVLITTRLTKSGRPSTAPKLVLQVTNTNIKLIQWLVKTWRMGAVTGGQRSRQPNHKPAYHWRIRGRTAARFLKQILPFLIIKRQQAKLGIHAATLANPYRKIGDAEMTKRLKLREKMMMLNQRGLKARDTSIPWSKS